MKLWLVGGDDRQLEYLAQHMVPDSFEIDHWCAKGERRKTGRQIAPDGTTHILLAAAHCYNVMAKSAREESRRLNVPFASFHGNPEMIETLAGWGYPRKLRAPRQGELEALMASNLEEGHAFFGDHRERKAENKRLHEIAKQAGLSSSLESVAACVWRLRGRAMEKLKQKKREKDRQKALKREEEEKRAAAEAERRKEQEAQQGRVEQPDVRPMPKREMLVEHLERALTIAKEPTDAEEWKAKYEKLREENEELRTKLKLVQEATQL